MPGRHLTLAYRELELAAEGTEEQKATLGSLSRLPRPWDPGTCTTASLRTELWAWIDAVVTWFNHDYVFDPDDAIASCWPRHPHLVHEIAVLADQRRRAAYTYTSDALENWHRDSVPAFLERMKHRVADHCTDGHPTTWPAAGRFHRHTARPAATDRQRSFTNDIASMVTANSRGASKPRLRLVDESTGEILD